MALALRFCPRAHDLYRQTPNEGHEDETIEVRRIRPNSCVAAGPAEMQLQWLERACLNLEHVRSSVFQSVPAPYGIPRASTGNSPSDITETLNGTKRRRRPTLGDIQSSRRIKVSRRALAMHAAAVKCNSSNRAREEVLAK